MEFATAQGRTLRQANWKLICSPLSQCVEDICLTLFLAFKGIGQR
jgi:hypothetical protein